MVRANRVTRKKLSLLGSKIGTMKTCGKAVLETKRTDNTIQKPQAKLRLATVNVGTLVGRAGEVVETAGRRKVDILALQEVRYKNEGVKYLKGGDFEYKMFWKGENIGQGGVAVMVKRDLVDSVMEVKRVSARILVVEIAINGKVLSVISVYGPQSGMSEDEKDQFYDELSAEVQMRNGECLVLGDFNGHVGSQADGFNGVHGGYGWGSRNREGERVLEFADSFDMVVGNTYFKKEDEKLITFKSGTNATTIDYVLVKKKALSAVKDVKVVPGEECFLQHRLLVVDLAWKQTKTWKGKIKERVKLWRLREDHIRKVIEEEIHEGAQNAESWMNGVKKS